MSWRRTVLESLADFDAEAMGVMGGEVMVSRAIAVCPSPHTTDCAQAGEVAGAAMSDEIPIVPAARLQPSASTLTRRLHMPLKGARWRESRGDRRRGGDARRD